MATGSSTAERSQHPSRVERVRETAVELPAGLKVAIVHDWLTNQGGGERVVEALRKAFPDAPIYTSVFNPRGSGMEKFTEMDVRTSFLQKWPWAKTKHQLYPVLRTMAFESFDFSQYDVVISSASAEAKGIITKPETLQLAYIHTPTRYYWSDYAKYRKETGFGVLSPLVRLVMPRVVERMRLWDFAAAQRPDHLIANSANVAQRITKYYRRPSTVIVPPVSLERFAPQVGPKRGFVVSGRLIPYKRFDLAVQACTELGLPLTVMGEGSELSRLKAMAGPTITFTGRPSDEQVARGLAEASALIFAGEEDFGIVPLEAMASGTPVIAYRAGGTLETVVEGKTGLFFNEQTVESLKAALQRFDRKAFDSDVIQRHAAEFGENVFIEKIKKFVAAKLKERQDLNKK
jgi:glycosyltransferase involved in cell wall biosynthesis